MVIKEWQLQEQVPLMIDPTFHGCLKSLELTSVDMSVCVAERLVFPRSG